MKKYLFLLLVLGTGIALASQTGANLPWESPLESLVDSITGPVAFAISLLAIVAAGAGLIFGGEISGFIKTVLYLVLVIAFIVGGASVMKMFSGAGMLI
ncbi:TrbC/VirB2 family protein [Arcobacter lacus]|uniref:TrbC/VirB2 family protein n=1 Tax=Arcobacter lacus TaxID=1912876 RepID=UPI0021BA8759|nr:TrbC/VirB2 family protein [Arcobacter lacus]MCT7910691.1 TrbC/VirB2 family protein [Arcobacter lacus]